MYKDKCCKATFFLSVASRLLMTHQVRKIISCISKEFLVFVGPSPRYFIPDLNNDLTFLMAL